MKHKDDKPFFLLYNDDDDNAFKHSIIKLFFAIFIPLALLITLLFYGMIAIDNTFELVTLKEREIGQAQVAAHLLEFENQQPVSELLIVSESSALKRYLASGNQDELKRLTSFFSNIILQKQSYDHIILMNANGNEILRVDRENGKPILNEKFNNNATDDYFQNTIRLGKNQVYISPLVVTPSLSKDMPIVSFGIPLFDNRNQKRGALIFSLSGQKILNDFNTAMLGKHVTLLVNHAGQSINTDNVVDSSDLGDQNNFSKSNPAPWSVIKKKSQGTFENNQGLYIFTTVYPLLSSKYSSAQQSNINFQSNANLSDKSYFWKIISFIPKNELPHFSLTRHPIVLGIYLMSLAILSLISAYFARLLSNRRQILRKLRHFVAEADDLYENAPVGYHSINDKGLYIRINSTELKWLGYSREEIIDKMHISDLMTPTGLRLFNEQFSRFKEKGVVNDLEFELIRKNGTRFTVLLNATAIYDKNNKYIMSRSIMIDITKRKQIEYALRESEERFRSTMDNAPIGMATINSDGKLTRVNETLLSVLNYQHGELQNKSLQEITCPEDIYLDANLIEELKIGKISHYKCEKRLLNKSNHPIWVQLTCSVVRNNQNEPHYFIAQIEDISERRMYQESVHHLAYHDTLTNLPNRRLFYDQLDKAIHKAQLSNQHLAVMYVDIDHFKSINDKLGHDVGDELLNVIASRLTSELRDNDLVSRTGGDEFVILLSKISSYKESELIANSIISTVRSPISLREHKLKVTVSIGIAIYPHDATQAKSLMKNADRAMYAAKNAGKDQYLSYNDCKEAVERDS